MLLKAACYRLSRELLAGRSVGVLGAARYVVSDRIARANLSAGHAQAQANADNLMAQGQVLEPTGDELELAAAIEANAQRLGLALDGGESQLAAIVILRALPVLETGDKRAIRGLEQLLDSMDELEPLTGRVRSLEQIVLERALGCDPGLVAGSICSERDVDKTLSICCQCYSPPPQRLDVAGLQNYIDVLREQAPRVLIG